MVFDPAPVAIAGSGGGDPEQRRREDRVARRFAAAYLLYGAVAVIFLAVNLPPFQNPDELAHFLRAAQVADFGLIGERFTQTQASGERIVTAGGLADPAIMAAYMPFKALPFHPEIATTRQSVEQRIRWSGQRIMLDFPNTSVYPPIFYLPAALGARIGQVSRMTVAETLVLSRVLTGVVALAAGAAAIVWAGGAAPLAFALLTLPMAFVSIASVSQDALILTFAALAGSLLLRASRRPDARDGRLLAGLTVTLALIATARPPYAGLALLPLAMPGIRVRWRVLASLAIVACAAAWLAFAVARALTNFGAGAGADPAAQLAILLKQPTLVFSVAKQTISLHWFNYVEGFVGRLGWYDTTLPSNYRSAALWMLGLAALVSVLETGGRRTGAGTALLIAAAVLLAAAGVFAALWLDWTVPGALIVAGVQGRYFLPIALAGVALWPALARARDTWPYHALLTIVAAFPVVTLAVVMRVVILRYYLG
jgi:uncharacterized membrane protein